MNRLIDLPYISFGKPFTPNEKSRKCLQFGEVMRVTFIDKEFFYIVANKKKNIAGVCTAAKIVQILKNKYYGDKLVPINVCYPNTWSIEKVKTLTDLINTHTDKSNYESIIYKYLLLLM
jgi:hypothetical protein